MEFKIQREELLKPLMKVIGVVERRQTLPILANVLIKVEPDQLSLTTTDLEVEVVVHIPLKHVKTPGCLTVQARKLFDICRALSDDSEMILRFDQKQLKIHSAVSRFSLAVLPAEDFPNMEEENTQVVQTLLQKDLLKLIQLTHFSMGHQDVRYYLNGMLIQLCPGQLRAVTSDGHRLSLSQASENRLDATSQVLVPRKGILELSRLLKDDESEIKLYIHSNYIRTVTDELTFTSQLIDGRFPNYEALIPEKGEIQLVLDREQLKNALLRASILSNEQHKGVRIELRENTLYIHSNNPEQEQAEEEMTVHYQGEDLKLEFNVNYLLDVLNVLSSNQVQLSFAGPNHSLIMTPDGSDDAQYVIMPMLI